MGKRKSAEKKTLQKREAWNSLDVRALRFEPFKKQVLEYSYRHTRMPIFTLAVILVIAFMIDSPGPLSMPRATWLLGLGLLIGFLDVPRSEQNAFLLASIGLLLAGNIPFQEIPYFSVGVYVRALLVNAALVLAPAVLVVGFKILYRIYLLAGKQE